MRIPIAISLLVCAPLGAVIVDRIAIAAGKQVITDSEIDQRIRLSAFENGDRPSFDASVRKTAADRLIDQKLVEHEMEVGHYPRLTSERSATLLTAYAKTNYKGDVAALDKALSGYGLTRADLEADLARQNDVLSFLSIRFRPAVQVTEQDIQKYFVTNIQPRLGAVAAGIDDFRNQIESEIAGQRADTDLEAWLKEQRRRTKIEYLEKDLAP
jgi:antitoxin component HigA of HigAB toxin-antitoxin module